MQKESLRNAKGQYVKGYSGNPGGRPKGSISKLLRKFMYDNDSNDNSRIHYMFHILWDKAMKGDITAIKIIMDRVDGTPRQSYEYVNHNEPIKILEIQEPK